MTLELPYTEWIKRGCPSAIVTMKYEMKRNEQMTREEAINKLNAVSVNTDVNNIFVNRLEALGLIKFDEPKPETAEQLLRRCGYNSADRILMILSDNGYDVVKR